MDFLLLLAVFPGLLIIKKTYDLDRIEKEPTGLLMKLVIFGALTAIPIVFFELFAEGILQGLFYEGSLAYIAVENFIGVALVEEGFKRFALKKITWKNREFNCVFDAVVYSVCVSMGFAILENIMYVLEGGIGTALMRAVLSVPGHGMFSVFMGHYYGLAKRNAVRGEMGMMRGNLLLSLWIPVLLHGFYDFCLSLDSGIMILVFFVFVIITYIAALRNLKAYAREDQYLYENVRENNW